MSYAGHLDQLAHLATLSLEDNQLKALPEAIGLCSSLIKLKCSTNLLRALPVTMGNLKKAQRLDFANNHILKVPPVIGHLKALKELNLRYCSMQSWTHLTIQTSSMQIRLRAMAHTAVVMHVCSVSKLRMHHSHLCLPTAWYLTSTGIRSVCMTKLCSAGAQVQPIGSHVSACCR